MKRTMMLLSLVSSSIVCMQNTGEDPLVKAAKERNLELVKQLVERGEGNANKAWKAIQPHTLIDRYKIWKQSETYNHNRPEIMAILRPKLTGPKYICDQSKMLKDECPCPLCVQDRTFNG